MDGGKRTWFRRQLAPNVPVKEYEVMLARALKVRKYAVSNDPAHLCECVRAVKPGHMFEMNCKAENHFLHQGRAKDNVVAPETTAITRDL